MWQVVLLSIIRSERSMSANSLPSANIHSERIRTHLDSTDKVVIGIASSSVDGITLGHKVCHSAQSSDAQYHHHLATHNHRLVYDVRGIAGMFEFCWWR